MHDPNGARLDIPDAKTDTGIREVELSGDLVEVIVGYLDDQRRAGADTRPNALLWPGKGGKKRTAPRETYARILERANGNREAAGLPPLPDRVTFHTLRRTYISIMLVASDYDLAYVMGQAGHSDHKTTLEIYNKLQKRMKRDHGRRFDTLLSDARPLLEGEPFNGSEGPLSDANGAEMAANEPVFPTLPKVPYSVRFAGILVV